MAITRAWAEAFARDWIESWNTHDLARVLSHYSGDFEMSSPFIAQMGGEPSGTLAGKERVAAYWQIGLEKLPDLHFELLDVLVGASSLAIHYRTNFGRDAVEVCFFNADGLVIRAAAHYRDSPR